MATVEDPFRQLMILVLSRKIHYIKVYPQVKKDSWEFDGLSFWGNQNLLKMKKILKWSHGKQFRCQLVIRRLKIAKGLKLPRSLDTQSVPKFLSSILKFVPWVEIIIVLLASCFTSWRWICCWRGKLLQQSLSLTSQPFMHLRQNFERAKWNVNLPATSAASNLSCLRKQWVINCKAFTLNVWSLHNGVVVAIKT